MVPPPEDKEDKGEKGEKEEINQHKYPKIEGKLKTNFGIQQNTINQLHNELYTLYTNSSIRKPVISSQIHNIILNLFTNDYYPFISRNIKSDNHTTAIIMGGIAFNMNVPNKMKFLHTETDDVDMKIYTTEINDLERNTSKLAHVMSIFKYIIIIFCMFMKQIMTEIIEYTRNIFEEFGPYKKHTMKKLNSKTIDFNTKTKKSSHKKSSQEQEGGFKQNKKIKVKQRRFGVLKNYKVIIEFKNNNQTERVKEAIDITDLSEAFHYLYNDNSRI